MDFSSLAARRIGCNFSLQSTLLGRIRRRAASLAAFAMQLAFASSAGAMAPPNIVLILMDDLGWSSTSVQSDPSVANSKSDFHQTPRLEQLAAQGMVFSHSYAAGPNCSPARAALMSGESPAQLQVTDVRQALNFSDPYFANTYTGFPLAPPQPRTTFPEEKPLLEAIKDATPAYRGGHYGKYDWQPNLPYEGWDSYNDLVTWRYTPQDPKAIFTITNNATTFIEQQVAASGPRFQLPQCVTDSNPSVQWPTCCDSL